jgi:Transposase DDE domain
MSKPSLARCRTTNWSSYTAALRKPGSLLIWLDKEMTRLAPRDGCCGRPAVLSDAAIQFCLTIKVLFKLPLRQTTGMMASLVKMADLTWAVPDYTTLCRQQKTLAVQIPYRRADGPLNLVVDITGIQAPWRRGMAGPQAWAAGSTPMAQGACGHLSARDPSHLRMTSDQPNSTYRWKTDRRELDRRRCSLKLR